jgi:hypothetical protein
LLILLTVLARVDGATLHAVWLGADRTPELVPAARNYDLSVDWLGWLRVVKTPSVTIRRNAVVTAFTSLTFGFTAAELKMFLEDVI